MSDPDFDAEVEELCVSMFESAKAIQQTISQLTAADRKAYLKEIQVNLLTMLKALTEMQPQRGKAAFSLFPELAVFEDMSPAQLGETIKMLSAPAVS